MPTHATPSGRKVFNLFLIKPSHNDDSYIIQWLRSAIPSNTLPRRRVLPIQRRS